MGDEAWKTVDKTAGFTPKEAPKGKSATKGYGISGRVTSVVKQGKSLEVLSTFTIWVDGTSRILNRSKVMGPPRAAIPPKRPCEPSPRTGSQ
jgi:hypothetical protein